MSAGKILLLILGVLIIVWSVGLLIAGGALLWVNSALMDSEGFLTTRTIDLEQDSHAIVTAPADIDLGVEWMWDAEMCLLTSCSTEGFSICISWRENTGSSEARSATLLGRQQN